MPLCGGHELLAAAERGGYAVPGFNVSNVEMIQGVIAAAEAKHAAVFLQFNPSNLEHMGGVEGWPEARGRALVSRLVAVATHEGAVYRHRWRAGDVLIWDNRTMIHRAQGFDPRHARVMHHVRVAGSEPPIPASR